MAEIQIFDVFGKLVKIDKINDLNTSMSVSELKSGIYLYTISENGHSIETKKLVVKN